MALWRELLKAALLAAALLALLPAAAMAAPQWLDAEPLETSTALRTAPRVAADAGGNAVAVWVGAGGEINAAYRPRGGPWGAADDLETEFPVVASVAPRVVALPGGEFVAVWIADRNGDGDEVLRSATRSTTGVWRPSETVDAIAVSPGITALGASANGSVTAISTDDGDPNSNTRAPNGTWGASEPVGLGSGTEVAVAPDGSAVAANTCGRPRCIRAKYRPPRGPWGPPEQVALTESANVSGLAVAAGPASSYTVVWAENTATGNGTGPPGAVRSSDRSAGQGGVWDSAPSLVADLPADSPGCPQLPLGCIDLAAGPDGTHVAVWQQRGASGNLIGANLRPSGGDWSATPEQAGSAGSGATSVAAGITTGGIPVAAWPVSRTAAVARGAHRGADGAWVQEPLGTPAAGTVALDDLAVDGDGNALTAWTDPAGASSAGFDGAGPRFSPSSSPGSFSVPATGIAGQTLTFSAAVDDNWSRVTDISWLFGDGGSADGGTVTHAYGAAGVFTATATATDSSGNTSQRSGSTTIAAAPTPTPRPDPCGTTDRDKDGIKDACDTNDGSKRPVPFKTVNATVVSGEVFLKLPAGQASAAATEPPRGFVRLLGANTIPVGSTLDTARGRVALRSASDTRRHVQSGQFFRGRFVIRQIRKPRGKAKRKSTKLITVLTLTGSSFSKTCTSSSKASASAKRRSRKRVRRLFGDAKGSFRTTGRNAAATVRGTRWGVQDRCDGTLVTVQRGRVSVRDLVRHKTVLVKTGHTYLARRR